MYKIFTLGGLTLYFRKNVHFITVLLLLFVLTVFLAACGGGDSANGNESESNDETEQNVANTDEQQNNQDEESKSADTSNLPRFITDPRGYYTFNDMIPFISTYEFIKDDATYRLEWLGEEEIDSEMAHKFHYLTDNPSHPEEYKEFHAWLDEGGFGVAARSEEHTSELQS